MEQEGKPENPAHRLGKRLRENRESLHIARIPPTTKEEFVKWADENFCSDYGMALKWLWDGIPKGDLLSAMEVLSNHEERLVALEEGAQVAVPKAEPKTEKRIIKKLDGSKLEVEENESN